MFTDFGSAFSEEPEVSSEELIRLRVVTRLRAFRQAELQLSSENTIQMSGSTLTLMDKESNRNMDFEYDACHWSHDEFIVNEEGAIIKNGPDSRFSDQEAIFNDIGKKMLHAAWQGKNTTTMGYGATGSGKSYTMLGHMSDPGLVYRCCRHLFAEIDRNPQNKYRVTVSMFEVYNEKVVDLLSKSIKDLKVRTRERGHVSVVDLTVVPMKSVSQLEELLQQGLQNRTIAATRMNASSSRSHLLITLHFKQFITREKGNRIMRSSRIRFVDMAGSERAKRSGTSGDRLQETKLINMSVSGLASVISALALRAEGKNSIVPYRNTKLTHLLCDDLGGNCEMTIIAAISPGPEDLQETLSTLRFASKAKMIVQKVSVNDMDVDIAVKKRKAAIVAKEAQLLTAESEQEKDELEKAIAAHQVGIRQLEANWIEIESKEKSATWWSSAVMLQKRELESNPYLQNISEDSLLSGITKHVIPMGHNLAGKSDSDDVKIQLSGLGIQPLHAIFENNGETLTIAPCSTRASVHVNGHIIHTPVQLKHLDHIKLGACELFIIVGFPEQRSTGNANSIQHSYEKCLTELAENHPLGSKLKSTSTGNARVDTANLLLFQEFMDLLPQVAQANALAVTLGKDSDFDVEVQREDRVGLKLYIHGYDRRLGMEWLWTKKEFDDRKLMMEELYENFLSSGRPPQTNQNNDPFYDAKKLDICLGRCKVSLHSLTYSLPVDDEIRTFDSRGRLGGCVQVSITPVSAEGDRLKVKASGLNDPKELLGKEFCLKFAFPRFSDVLWVAGSPQRGVFCKVTLLQNKVLTTEKVFGAVSGKFHSTFPLTIESVRQWELTQLASRPLVLELWGTQNPSMVPPPVQSAVGPQQISANSSTPSGGGDGLVLDLNLALDLRQFFKNMCPLQRKLQHLKKQAQEKNQAQESAVPSWAECSAQVEELERELKQCVEALKDSVRTAIRRTKQS